MRTLQVVFLSAAMSIAVLPTVYGQVNGYGQPAPRANYIPANPNARGAGPNTTAIIKEDQAQIATAQTNLADAKSALASATAKATTDFHKGSDYTDAKKAVDDALAAQQKLHDSIINKLRSQSEYRQAAANEAAANTKLDQMKANGADRAAIAQQSLDNLKIAAVTSSLENQALSTDTAYTDATKKLADARAALKAMEDKFTASLKTDSTIDPLSAAVDDAKTKLAAAQAKLKSDQTGTAARAGG